MQGTKDDRWVRQSVRHKPDDDWDRTEAEIEAKCRLLEEHGYEVVSVLQINVFRFTILARRPDFVLSGPRRRMPESPDPHANVRADC